jgi:lipoprotein NlpI
MGASRSGDGGYIEIFGDAPSSSRRCAFCLQDVGADPSESCPKCASVYHPDCWAANDRKCAIYGCEPAPAPPPAPARPRVLTLPVARREGFWSGLGRGGSVFGMIVLVNILRYLGTCHSTHSPSPESELRYRAQESHSDFVEGTDQIARHPRSAKGYLTRAAYFQRKGLWPMALQDLDKAIELDPRSGPAHHQRGHVLVGMHDLKGAVSDFGRAWALDPRDPEPIYDRACASYDLQKWEDCVKDFAQVYEKIPSLRRDAQIRFCLARSRMGQRAAAERDLVLFLERGSISDPWIEELLRFVAGLSNEEMLFAAAEPDPKERLCQANYYAGTLRLLDDDEEQARMYFNACLDTRSTQLREYASAEAELRVLERKYPVTRNP